MASAGAEGAEGAAEALLRRWGEPHRRYHSVAHLSAVLGHLDWLDPAPAEAGRAARLAAWYHDAVYDPRADDNEARSADLARVALTGLGVAAELADGVARLVLLTATHDPAPGDQAGTLLCDADLAILGTSLPSAYDAYVVAVRAEYGHLDEAAWRVGRRRVLGSLVARDRLFATAAGRQRWEAPARANLARELAG